MPTCHDLAGNSVLGGTEAFILNGRVASHSLDILGRGGLKTCLMTNCMVSMNSIAPSCHFSYTSSVCSKHLYLESTLGRQPPCRRRQISPVPAPRASYSSKPQSFYFLSAPGWNSFFSPGGGGMLQWMLGFHCPLLHSTRVTLSVT